MTGKEPLDQSASALSPLDSTWMEDVILLAKRESEALKGDDNEEIRVSEKLDEMSGMWMGNE